jgi:hypothetical protein
MVMILEISMKRKKSTHTRVNMVELYVYTFSPMVTSVPAWKSMEIARMKSRRPAQRGDRKKSGEHTKKVQQDIMGGGENGHRADGSKASSYLPYSQSSVALKSRR